MPRVRNSSHCVYVVSHPDGMIKIGKTGNLQKRFKDLQVHNPHPLKFEYAVFYERYCPLVHYLEKAVQTQLGRYWVSGEWFKADPALAVSLIRQESTISGRDFGRMQPFMHVWRKGFDA